MRFALISHAGTRRSINLVVALVLTVAGGGLGHYAHAQAPAGAAGGDAAAPYVTPSTDVDVTYLMTAPDGHPPVQQRMRWQVASLRQRIDPEGSAVYMLTSWQDRTLTVVDTLHRRRSDMPVPGAGLTLPGHLPSGVFNRLGTDNVAGQACTSWRTVDQDGHGTETCYTADGILVRVVQQGVVLVKAQSVLRQAQPDTVFTVPEGLTAAAPAH